MKYFVCTIVSWACISTIAVGQQPRQASPKAVTVGTWQLSVESELGRNFPSYVGEGPALWLPSPGRGEAAPPSIGVYTDDGRLSTYTAVTAAATSGNVLARLRVRVQNTGRTSERFGLGEVRLTCGASPAELMALGRGTQALIKRGNWMDQAKAESVWILPSGSTTFTYLFIVPRGSGSCTAAFRGQTLTSLQPPPR